ncbi:hypothetical protein QTP88_028005 [Uroleucon formosanum]
MRREETNEVRAAIEYKATGRRPRGRPKKRWMDRVQQDLERLEVIKFRALVMSSLDYFDNEVVRRTIHSFYDKDEFPTTAKILVAMQEKINYPSYVSLTYFTQFELQAGSLLGRNMGKPEPYTRLLCQNPENAEGLKVPIGKGARLIVCHAGSPSFGFVNNSKLVFRYTEEAESERDKFESLYFAKRSQMQEIINADRASNITVHNVSHGGGFSGNRPQLASISLSSFDGDIQEWLG